MGQIEDGLIMKKDNIAQFLKDAQKKNIENMYDGRPLILLTGGDLKHLIEMIREAYS